MSADKRQGVVVIAFVGSVFSPFYFAERARLGSADPMDFCALNVALYDGGKRTWGFTEFWREHVTRNAQMLAIGGSRITREADRICLTIDEAPATGSGRISGEIVLHPKQVFGRRFFLGASGAHRWYPVAPLADIEVNFRDPDIHFKGSGYHDVNEGDEPLEASLKKWSWSRHDVGAETVALYDGTERDDSSFSMALLFRRDGTVDELTPPPLVKLPRSFWWRCPRATRSDGPGRPKVIRTLEDSPFYARTLIESRLFGKSAPGVHESLVLDTFTTKWMQWMLPYRIKRVS